MSPSHFWHLCCAQGQGRVRLRFFPQPAQRLRRGQPKVQDRFPEHEALLRRGGEKEVQQIHPGRIPLTVNFRNASVKLEDSIYKGAYLYPPDAVNPQCGTVKIAVYSSKSEEPVIKTLDSNTTNRIWADFDAFRRADAEAHPTQAQR